MRENTEGEGEGIEGGTFDVFAKGVRGQRKRRMGGRGEGYLAARLLVTRQLRERQSDLGLPFLRVFLRPGMKCLYQVDQIFLLERIAARGRAERAGWLAVHTD